METITNQLNEFITSKKMSNEAPQFTYLIGVNGTGKTRVLNSLARSQIAASRVSSVSCITNSVFDKFTYTGGAKNSISYHGLRSVGNAIFLSSISRAILSDLLGGIASKRNFLKNITAAIGVEFEFSFPRKPRGLTPAEILVSLIDRRRLKRAPIGTYLSRAEMLVVRRFVGQRTPLTSIKKSDALILARYIQLYPQVYLYVVRNPKEKFEFNQLSSGEQNRILLATKISICKSERALLLIDEPEISLHLQWQVYFHQILMDLTRDIKRFHVVIATHSPIIISEAAKMPDKVRIVELFPAPKLTTDDAQHDGELQENEFVEKIYFNILKEYDLRNFDAILLDCFRTSPHNSEVINKEITDIVLKVAERDQITLDDKARMEMLKKTVGATPQHQKIITKAIAILEKNFPLK